MYLADTDLKIPGSSGGDTRQMNHKVGVRWELSEVLKVQHHHEETDIVDCAECSCVRDSLCIEC